MTERVWIIKEDSHHKGTLNRFVALDMGDVDKLIVNATVSQSEANSDAERLAIAVLQGSTDAALALADEVQMAFKSKGKYRTREQIIKEHNDLLDYCEEMRLELARYRNVDARPAFHERAKYE